MPNKKQRMKNRESHRKLTEQGKGKPVCPNCGEEGSHFIPPGFGSGGEFACAKKP